MLRLVPKEEPGFDFDSAPRVIVNAERVVVPWVERRLGLPTGHFQSPIALGILLGDKAAAGVLFTSYRKHPETGCVTVDGHVAAGDDPRWLTRPVLRVIFRYAFVGLNASRLQSVCRRKDARVRAFNERLGFKLEGIGRRAWDGKQDAACYSMLPHECKWLKGPGDGKEGR